MSNNTLYVSDLDGTLLGDDSQLSDATVAMLNEAIAGGAQFTAATARTPATAGPLLERVDITLPLVVMSGAALWDCRRKRFTAARRFEPATIEQIVEVFNRHGLHPLVYRRRGNELHVHHWGALHGTERTFVDQRLHSGKIFHLDDADYAHAEGEAMIFFSMNDYDRLVPVERDIATIVDCRAFISRDIFDPAVGLLEVYPAGTSKANAIARLAKQTGADRVVVFGDNINDLDMMRAADWSVAVENAIEPVRHAAREVIGPNSADSVARYILNAQNGCS